jgi:hypothetical protein
MATSSTPVAPKTGTALIVGVAGLAVAALGFAVSPAQHVALSYLVGFSFCTAIAIGMLLWVLIHHIFDAGWSVVPRRQLEHGLAAFLPLAILFLPLLISAWVKPGLIWSWMDASHPLHGGHGTVGEDVLYVKKAGFLSLNMFTGMSVAFFAIWIWLSSRLRKASFTQDKDGDIKWTLKNRVTAAMGIPLVALALTFAAIYWFKSLEYHWFSTMYGVWFFANCMRGALAVLVFIMIWLYARGDFKGVVNTNHWHAVGTLTHAFTIFWAYVTFSQYFLIWNANVPEETFWYNLREMNNSDGQPNQWKWVGMVILFGHFFLPFLYLLSYRLKSTPRGLRFISVTILATILIDLCYNILPALRDSHGDPLPFLSLNLVWTLASVAGVGGFCVWAYLRSFATADAKLIPIRDPRIVESLTYHEATAPEAAPAPSSSH